LSKKLETNSSSKQLWVRVKNKGAPQAASRSTNLQCLYNRIAYAHWSALYRRAEKVHLAHSPVAISLQD